MVGLYLYYNTIHIQYYITIQIQGGVGTHCDSSSRMGYYKIIQNNDMFDFTS